MFTIKELIAMVVMVIGTVIAANGWRVNSIEAEKLIQIAGMLITTLAALYLLAIVPKPWQ